MKRLLCASLSLLMLLGCSKGGVKLPYLDPSSPPTDYTKYTERNPIETDRLGFTNAVSLDLTSFDFKSKEQLEKMDFDDKTIWPQEIPFNFNPQEIMEINKNPGLDVRTLHEKNYTGKGVNIAIIDQPLLLEHVEYTNRLVYYKNLNNKTSSASMHGSPVASILAGQTLGVAPECNLYYVAFNSDLAVDLSYIEAINHLLDLNETLPEKEKIRVISISKGFDRNTPYYSNFLEAQERAKKHNIALFTVYTPFPFIGLKKPPTSNPDDFSSYTPHDTTIFFNAPNKYIYIPESNITTASPTGIEDYVYYAFGGMSWVVPYIAGCYALALQADPELTLQQFYNLAYDTGIFSSFTQNNVLYDFGPIINPAGIIEALAK